MALGCLSQQAQPLRGLKVTQHSWASWGQGAREPKYMELSGPLTDLKMELDLEFRKQVFRNPS